MNDKELKKLSRRDLLELLVEQTERIEELEKELSKTKKKLNDKNIKITEAGNIAEAALKITDLFNKTQEACKLYKDNIDELNSKVEEETRKKYEKLAKKKLSDTEKMCNKKIEQANEKLKEANKTLREAKKSLKSSKKELVKN